MDGLGGGDPKYNLDRTNAGRSQPMEHAATANGDHRSQVLVTVDSTNHSGTTITTSTTSALLIRTGVPAIAPPLRDTEIDALLAPALQHPTVAARSTATQQWFSSMTKEQQTILELGLEAIVSQGCHMAAKRSYETILMQKRANNEANQKKLNVTTTIPAKSTSKSIDSSSKGGSTTGREGEEQSYGRDVDSYSASANSASKQTVTSYTTEYYYRGSRGPTATTTTSAAIAPPTAVRGVGRPYYDDYDHSRHRRHSRDRDYFDDRLRHSSRSREQRQERCNDNDFDNDFTRRRSNSKTRRDRQRQSSRSPTQDESQRPNHPRSRSRSPSRRNDRDYDRDTLSASFRSRSLDPLPPQMSRLVDNVEHKERQRRIATEITASHAVASVRKHGLDDASFSRRHRRSRTDKGRDNKERPRRSGRNRSPSTDSRSSWSFSRSSSPDIRVTRTSEHYYRHKGSRHRRSSSGSESSNRRRTNTSKEESQAKRCDKYHSSTHQDREKKRHGSSNSPGDIRGGPQSEKQSNRRSSRKRKRNKVPNGTDSKSNLK